jgi:uncharacterized protein involved in type VI secretion and phage assembly
MKASIILAGLLTMGCATVPPEEPAVPQAGTGKTCNAAPAQGLFGRTRSEALAAEALRLTGAGALRWIAPGMMVTMDFREDRLNLEIDAQNRITRVRCG